MAILNHSYFNLLFRLQEHCNEVGIKLNPKKEEFIQACKGNKILRKIPYYPLENVFNNLKTFVNDDLTLYFVAKHINERELSQKFLSFWKNQLITKIDTQLALEDNVFYEKNLLKKKIDQVIKDLCSTILLPNYAKASPEIEFELCKGVKNIIAQDIIHQAFVKTSALENIIPEYIIYSHPKYQTPPHFYNYLIEKYASYKNIIDFKIFDHLELKDFNVHLDLILYPYAEEIDLSNFLFITSACLNVGHKCAKKIILTGTNIKISDVPKNKFPALKELVQDYSTIVLKLDKNFSIFRQGDLLFEDKQWQELFNAIINVDFILTESKIIEKLLTLFKNAPSREGFRTLSLIERNQNNFKLELSYFKSKSFWMSYSRSYHDVWENQEVMNQDT